MHWETKKTHVTRSIALCKVREFEQELDNYEETQIWGFQ